MSPYEQALNLYDSRPDMSLENDLRLHCEFGYVVSTSEVFAMVRPTSINWETCRFQDISRTTWPQYATCWFVWLLCGSLKEAVKHLPYHLPWFGFSQRGQEVRFVDAEKVLAKIG
jgi:hypothetical protein